METLDCIKSRRSIRKYRTDKEVEFEKTARILEAGSLAPSAGNLQDWKFILVIDLASRKKIAEACLEQYWMETAPVHIVVCAESKKGETSYGERGEKLYSVQNCAVAVENMLLASNDLGLGGCMVSAFEEGMLRRVLNIPDEVVPQAVVTIGYADETPAMPSKFSIENVTFIEKWGNKIMNLDVYSGYYAKEIKKAVEAVKGPFKRIFGTRKQD